MYEFRRLYKYGILESEWNIFKQIVYENYISQLNEDILDFEVITIIYHLLFYEF